MHLKIFAYDMKLKYPFSISRHTYYSQQNVIIELHHNKFVGYGEATVNPYYNITIENLKENFYSINKRLKNYTFNYPDQLFDDFSDYLEINSFALGALNNASWDLYGKIKHLSVSELIKLPKKKPPLTSYTLGIDSKEAMENKMNDFPWPVYKIKLGTANDLDLIKHVKNHTKSMIRVDANCAWNASDTLAMSKELKLLGVEFIERPLPYNDQNQKLCFEKTSLPLMADESCRTEHDIKRCQDKFHGINIKLLKCGGLSPALRMIKTAKQLGLKQ